jgi:hypothetical protein
MTSNVISQEQRMDMANQDVPESNTLEFPAATVAKLRQKADSAGQPLALYLQTLAEQCF